MVIAGNATLDTHILDATVSVVPPNIVRITSGGVTEKFVIADGPIKPGYKHRVDEDIVLKVLRLVHQFRAGGGGYNQTVAFRTISTDQFSRSNFELVYVDVSQPHPIVEQELKDVHAGYHFLNLPRSLPYNLVVGGKNDRYLLKGRQLPRMELQDSHRATIDDLVEGSAAVVVNSAKDPSFVEALISSAEKRDIPMYFVVTDSLPKDFILTRMMPHGPAIMNDEDITSIFGYKPTELDEEQRMQLALELMRKTRMDYPNQHDMHVTLGRHGAFSSTQDGKIAHVFLVDEWAEKVKSSVERNNGNTSGAGDTYAAAVLYHSLTSSVPVWEIVLRASRHAIRYIGYRGYLPPSGAFEIKFK